MTTLSLPGWAGQAAYTRSLQRSRGNPTLNRPGMRPGFFGNTGVTSTGQISQGQGFNNPKTSQFSTSSAESGFDNVGGDLPPPATGPGSNPTGGYADLPAPLPINPFSPTYPPSQPMGPWQTDPRIDPSVLTQNGMGGGMDAGGWENGGYFSPQGNYYNFSSPNGWWIGPSGYPAAIQANNNPFGMPGFFGGGSAHSGSFYGPLGGNVSAGSWNTVGGLPWARGQAQF